MFADHTAFKDINFDDLFPSLSIDKSLAQLDTSLYSERDAILHKIHQCLLSFCESTFYYSARFIRYDQSVGMFAKVNTDTEDVNLYHQKLWCASDFAPFPRGYIVYSIENQRIANVANLVFMMLNKIVPMRFISELECGTDTKTNVFNNHTTNPRKIYKIKRTSGEIQDCILGEDSGLYMTKPTDSVPNEWRLKLCFNNAENNDLSNLNMLKIGYTTFEKRVPLSDFCKLNNITSITIDLTKMETQVSLKSDIDVLDQNEHAIYNEDDTIYTYYRDNRESIQDEILHTYFGKTKKYLDIVKTTFPEELKVNII